jgi:hypothetical protein
MISPRTQAHDGSALRLTAVEGSPTVRCESKQCPPTDSRSNRAKSDHDRRNRQELPRPGPDHRIRQLVELHLQLGDTADRRCYPSHSGRPFSGRHLVNPLPVNPPLRRRPRNLDQRMLQGRRIRPRRKPWQRLKIAIIRRIAIPIRHLPRLQPQRPVQTPVVAFTPSLNRPQRNADLPSP